MVHSSGGFRRRVEARSVLRAERTSPAFGRDLDEGLRLLEEFLAECAGRGYAPDSLMGYRSACRHVLVWLHQSRIPMRRMDADVLERRSRGCGPSSVPTRGDTTPHRSGRCCCAGSQPPPGPTRGHWPHRCACICASSPRARMPAGAGRRSSHQSRLAAVRAAPICSRRLRWRQSIARVGPRGDDPGLAREDRRVDGGTGFFSARLPTLSRAARLEMIDTVRNAAGRPPPAP